jgi:mannitol operon transcriptional antiterminator
MYTSRLAKILLICMEYDDYITYQTISNRLQISNRTIMRELTNVNAVLKKENMSLDFKKGTGIKLLGTKEDIEKLKITLMASQIPFASKEERQELLCLELLNSNEVQKIMYYARLFDVSQTTIINDLNDLLPFFMQHRLTLNRRQGKGVQVTGKEEDVRKALSLLINKSVGHHLMDVDFDRYNIQAVLEQLFVSSNSNMTKLLNQDILQEILTALKQQRENIDLRYMAKNSYIGLLIHLMIAVKRIKQGEEITYNEQMETLDYDEDSCQKAKRIIACLGDHFNITFPRSEVLFITIHLESAKKALISEEQEDYQAYLPLINRMLVVFKDHGYHLKQDYVLLQGIVAHLKPALIRLQFGLPIYNPMLKKIKEDYSDIFHITKIACQEITKVYQYPVNEDEIGYLSLHFGAALERQKYTSENLQQIKVGIVCSSGIGMSALLSARLRQMLDSNVYLQLLSLHQIAESDCALFVSTFYLEHDNAIMISPLLSNKDIYIIKEKIKEKREMKEVKQVQSTKEVDLSVVLSNVTSVLDNLQIYTLKQDINKVEVITLGATYITEQAETLASQIVVREERGSNVYHQFGFALLHCATDLVSTCDIRLFRSDSGEFKDGSLMNIRLIVWMLIPMQASSEQQQMMSYITTMLLENENFYQTLSNGTSAEVKTAFNKVLKQYLVEYLQEVG